MDLMLLKRQEISTKTQPFLETGRNLFFKSQLKQQLFQDALGPPRKRDQSTDPTAL